MTHPDLVELASTRWPDLRAAEVDSMRQNCNDFGKAVQQFAHRTGCPAGGDVLQWLDEAAAKILTLQSSLAEQEKTISKLRGEVKEAKAVDEDGEVRTAADIQELLYERDGFIVSKGLWSEFVDSLPRKVVRFASALAEARNSGLEEAAKYAHAVALTQSNALLGNFGDTVAAAIRSLKSQEKKK